MIKRILSFLLVLSMLLAISPLTANAATLDELNEPQMFEKQIGSGKCTLAAAAMLVKRTSRALGQTGWENINSNNDAFYKKVWKEGVGLWQSFAYNEIQVKHGYLNTALPNAPQVALLLLEHPEGIILYNGGTKVPGAGTHAVLITDYTDGVFYCADPTTARPDGRIPLASAWGITIDNATRYWYVSSPKVTLTPSDDAENPDDGNDDGTITTPTPDPDLDPDNLTPFTDIKSTDWFYPFVEYTYNNNLITGMSETEFRPSSNLTRAQFATILYRMNGEVSSYEEKFADVPGGEWYSEAITWAANAGIVSGYNETTFGTNDKITREQMAAMMFRYATYKGYNVETTASLDIFPDASSVTAYAVPALEWAVGNEIINGRTNGSLDPLGNATRAECATIITRVHQTFNTL